MSYILTKLKVVGTDGFIGFINFIWRFTAKFSSYWTPTHNWYILGEKLQPNSAQTADLRSNLDSQITNVSDDGFRFQSQS